MAKKIATAKSARLKVRKGDKVTVITGRDKGKTGEILRVDPKRGRVLVQGVNMVKRHQGPTQTNPGGIIEKEASLHVSNVAHIDPKSNQPTRVGYRIDSGGRKVRFAKRSGELIDL
jgi:large subunit ribosomal protein L24